MSAPDEPTLDDVMTPTESAPRDRREHAKAPMHVNDEELQHRTEQERAEVDADRGEITEE